MRRSLSIVSAVIIGVSGVTVAGCASNSNSATTSTTTKAAATNTGPTLGTWMTLSGFLKFRTDGLTELKNMTTALSTKAPTTSAADQTTWRVNLFSSIKGSARLMKITGAGIESLNSPNATLNKQMKNLGAAYVDLGNFADNMNVANIVKGTDKTSLKTLVSKVQAISALNKSVTTYSTAHVHDSIKL